MAWYSIHVYITATTKAEYKSEFEPTKDTPYLVLMGELWGVFCDDFRENLLHYNATALYLLSIKLADWTNLYDMHDNDKIKKYFLHHWHLMRGIYQS